MTNRVSLIPMEDSLRLGSELGVTEAQASRGAFRMLAHHPDLAKQVYGLLTALTARNKLPLCLRELMAMHIAWLTRSEYEWFQHYRIATTQAGISQEEVVAVRDWKNFVHWGRRIAPCCLPLTIR